jgi:hypothetical protein
MIRRNIPKVDPPKMRAKPKIVNIIFSTKNYPPMAKPEGVVNYLFSAILPVVACGHGAQILYPVR